MFATPGMSTLGKSARKRLQRVVLVRVLLGPPVVEALALETILQRVLEAARVDQPERRQQAHALVHEARQVVVVGELEEEAVLAQMARPGHGIVERVAAVADGLRPDAHRIVGAQAETHLTPVVEREGESGSGADQHQQRNQRLRQMPFHAPPHGCRHSATSDERAQMNRAVLESRGFIRKHARRCQGRYASDATSTRERSHQERVSPIAGVQMRPPSMPRCAAAAWKRRGGSSSGSSVRSKVP